MHILDPFPLLTGPSAWTSMKKTLYRLGGSQLQMQITPIVGGCPHPLPTPFGLLVWMGLESRHLAEPQAALALHKSLS